MNIFNVINNNFFSILNSKNKEFYAKCLRLIFEKTESENSFSYSRKELVSDIIELLNSEILEEFNEFEDDSSSLVEKANIIIRKLKDTGWILEGLNRDYTKNVFFANEAIPFVNAIMEIVNNSYQSKTVEEQEKVKYYYSSKVEIDGYAHTVNNLLKAKDLNESTIIIQVYDNLKHLINSLKQLNYSIKKYSDTVKIGMSTDNVIKEFFTEYTNEILNKNFHKIKTLDNISKYKANIVNNLIKKIQNPKYIDKVALEFVKFDYARDVIEAKQQIMEMLKYSLSSVQNISEIVYSIEEENYLYSNIILKKTRFIVNNYDDVEGYLKTIIKTMMIHQEEENYHANIMKNILSAFTFNNLTTSSLYKVKQARNNSKNKRLELDLTINKEVNEIVLNKIRNSKHSLKVIEEYVEKCLGKKKRLQATDLKLETIDDFVYLIFIIIYSNKSDIYKIDFLNETATRNDINFRNFVIRRENYVVQ